MKYVKIYFSIAIVIMVSAGAYLAQEENYDPNEDLMSTLDSIADPAVSHAHQPGAIIVTGPPAQIIKRARGVRIAKNFCYNTRIETISRLCGKIGIIGILPGDKD